MSDGVSPVHPKRLVVSVFLILIGIVIGVTLVAEFLPPSRAVEATKKIKPPAISQSERTFVEIAKAVTPAVVNISATRVVRREEQRPSFPFQDPFFRRFFGEESPHPGIPRQRKEQSLGSGVIIDSSGLIVTNNHVVAKADQITVVLSDKREFKGTVIGSDPKSDIAAIRIEADDLPVAEWADSDQLEVGEYVLAIGNPFGLNQTVTMGIVSAIGRANVGVADYEDFIQTDAAINPGNSGGALVDTHGALVGINTAIFSQSGGYMGIGFAVPSNMVRSVLESLVEHGKVVRGWLGISIQEVTPQLAREFGLEKSQGALIADVLAGSPAQKAGLKQGDVVISLMGRPIDGASQLRNQVAQIPVGERARIIVIRNHKEKIFDVKIEEQPEDLAQSDGADEPDEEEEGNGAALAGMEVRTLTPALARKFDLGRNQKGVVVMDVASGSAAEQAGVLPGDLIMEMNRRPIRSLADYREILSDLDEAARILLLVSRQGKALFLSIGER